MRSIPQSILNKINKQNQTIYENANPKMNVVVARAKSSVRDSSYFTIEKIKQKEGITDIAVEARRMLPYGTPDRIYNIHIDNGLIRTMHREYPDKLKAGWQNDFDIENGKGVSIAFDGRWIMNKYKQWGKADNELPWLFWIDNSNNLKGRIWNTGTIYNLATDVLKVDSIRGWIPAQAGHTDDQGIIVAYIKSDGKVYYKNYCIQEFDDLIIWESEKEVTELGVGNLGIRLFRTNDFRVGFIAEKASENMMIITARNWGGMSIPPEKLVSRVKVGIDFIPLEFIGLMATDEHLTTNIDNTIYLCSIDKLDIEPISIERAAETQFKIKFDVDLFNVVLAEGFSVKNESGTVNYNILNISFDGITKELIINLVDEMPKAQNIKVNYLSDFNSIRVSDDDVCKLALDTFEMLSNGVPDDGYLSETIKADVDIVIDFVGLSFDNVYASEKVEADINIFIEFWSIDDAPV